MVKSKIELAINLGRAMAELRNELRQYIQVKLKAHGINMTFEMLEVMTALWKQDGVNQQDLADQTLKDKSSMTYLIDNLVKRELVQRVEDENDRRNKLIYITDEAKELKNVICPWVAEVYGNATVDVDMPELEDGLVLFNQMIKNLKHK
jgi:DNA-binding MarR family transcriptional regulator